MKWYKDREIMFLISLSVGITVAFGGKIFKPIVRAYHRATGKPHKKELIMPPKAFKALERLRKKSSKLKNKEVSFDELVEDAVGTYYKIFRAHQAGSTFVLEHKSGRKTPLKIFLD